MEHQHSELKVEVWRGRNDGQFVAYDVAARANQTVLDVVTEIQRHQAPDLAYRFACRVGVCGSCAMMVNGRPTWTCRSHVQKVAPDGKLRIAPLRNLPLIKDLVADLAPFFEKWQRSGGQHKGSADRHAELATIEPLSDNRQNIDAGIECINCAVCYSACDTVAWRSDYLGPAALNRAWTIVNDTRHGERHAVLDSVLAEGGCTQCHSLGACTASCPQELDPSTSIAQLKRLGSRRFWKRNALP